MMGFDAFPVAAAAFDERTNVRANERTLSVPLLIENVIFELQSQDDVFDGRRRAAIKKYRLLHYGTGPT